MPGWIENLRKWIDGEDDLDERGEPKPRSKWDDFLVAVAREIEASMQREMFTPPGGPTYVPREYIVFMSPSDDSEWQGEKREGLERGLHYVLSERAKEIAGDNEFQTRTLTVELRVDPGLEAGRFRVQHVWDTEAQKTMVKPRKRVEPTPPDLVTVTERVDDEATVVRPRKSAEPASPLFSVQVSRKIAGAESAPPDVRQFFKDEITIGRGARQTSVDLRLEGDMEVSRQHATLSKIGNEYTLTCKGANPVVVNDEREISAGDSATVKSGDKITVCSYELTVLS
ncbi:MAG TPA: FhaA domain-containing protein [Blastocatellia bacterium]|nr:FhaA domain-containing protein [Blastocatellia bacterium]